MAGEQAADYVIRRAQMPDRQEVLSVVNAAFSRDEEHPFDFLRILPYLFEPERIGDQIVRLEHGRIVGCVGLYPYEIKVGGVSFRAAGLGQVGTLRQERGRGVMTSLLKTACHDADAAGYDFCWLGGDRLRYGRFGWATGGLRAHFNFSERYLPDPPPQAEVRPLEPERDFQLVLDHLAQEPNTVLAEPDELGKILRCDNTGGWVSGDAFIVYRRRIENVYLGAGAPEAIARLLSHHLRWLKSQTEQRGDLAAECALAPSPLMAACQRYYAYMTVGPSGMFRVGPLTPFLEKACRAAQPKVACGSGRVSLADSETGETVTVACRRGRLSVQPGACERVYSLGRRELSELCFGLCPLDLHLPGLPEDSFLRRVLPLPAYWSRFFGV